MVVATISKTDWPPAEIKAELTRRSLSLRRLSRDNGLHEDTLRDALRRPYPAAEAIIAEAIGRRPQDIWPCRYLPNGEHRGGRAREDVKSSTAAAARNVQKATAA